MNSITFEDGLDSQPFHDSDSGSDMSFQSSLESTIHPATTVVLVPGFLSPGQYADTDCFDVVADLLRKEGFDTGTHGLGSTENSRNTITAEVSGLHKRLETLVEEGRDIFLVLHCVAGVIGSIAMEGLAKKTRGENGLKGGVIGILFVAAGVLPGDCNGEDFCEPLNLYPEKPSENWQGFFDRLDWEALQFWRYYGHGQRPKMWWRNPVTYCGWKDVPSIYLVCSHDDVIPSEIQSRRFLRMAGSDEKHCDAGHMPMSTTPYVMVNVIKEAVDKVWVKADRGSLDPPDLSGLWSKRSSVVTIR